MTPLLKAIAAAVLALLNEKADGRPMSMTQINILRHNLQEAMRS
jgi:hypothetical protein